MQKNNAIDEDKLKKLKTDVIQTDSTGDKTKVELIKGESELAK